ncbi:hypothetical protein KAR50_07450 [Periweissella fabaria]|uniref:Uncharacterized protein n=1 Tax=Periweissella fabaria TaxID=546157 RepID=A0ABM8Z7Z8_9LACO|nr:hypothetical protein [Periweissella fabaria]MCM0597677.1 hypothetical protein [Periweissella fabaria]CAH0416862.1 hypothetical protein WFA24289_01175 [Periweissella fabaria]
MGNFSDWYNWDLHIHTPETELNDNFQDENGHRENKEDVWKRYCKEINGYNADVLGITDYFSVNNYFKLKENRKKWGLRDDIVLMPNMELRVNDITSKKRAKGSGDSSFVNLHIIFDPNIDREYLDKFLRKLTVTDIDDKEINFKEDRDKIFINQEIKYLISTKDVIKALENVFGKNFSDKCLIMLPNTQDGIVLESGNGSQNGINFAKRYVSLLQARTNKAQEDIEYLRKKDNSYGKIFSVVTGSDAHRLDDLENFSNRSRTWIKADKTFNGLK